MLIAAFAVVLIAVIPLCGGRYAGLASMQLRGTWLIVVALAIQVTIISVLDLDAPIVSQSMHIFTYVLAGAYLLSNRTIPRIWVVALGWFCNFMAITANGGVMPTSIAAARAVGREASDSFENSAPTSSAHLAFLGDTIATPSHLPLANVVSIGDLALMVGLTLVLIKASRTKPGLADSIARENRLETSSRRTIAG